MRPIKEYLHKNKGKCKIELIRHYPCGSLLDLTREETKYINENESEFLLNVRQRKRKNDIEKTQIKMKGKENVTLDTSVKCYHEYKEKRFTVRYKGETKKYSYAKRNDINEVLEELKEEYKENLENIQIQLIRNCDRMNHNNMNDMTTIIHYIKPGYGKIVNSKYNMIGIIIPFKHEEIKNKND